MKYERVVLEGLGYELAPIVVSSSELEERLRPAYDALRIPPGQLEALTGISERRWWDPGTPLSRGAVAAGRKALQKAGIPASAVEVLIYGGVCRENFEPATACRVAAGLEVGPDAAIYDVSNACLGVLNGIVDIGNRIELGQIRAGLVVSCESAREITETMIDRLVSEREMEAFRLGLATLTGGSGAVAVCLSDGSFSPDRPRLVGGVSRAAPEHHELCRWGLEPVGPDVLRPFMSTDSVAVLRHGVELGKRTWEALLDHLGWTGESVDRVVCHQVGSVHQSQVLEALGIPEEKDYVTYPFLGNVGTVSLPLTAALAAERGRIRPGHRVAFLGIGSGLNCLMLGWDWQ